MGSGKVPSGTNIFLVLFMEGSLVGVRSDILKAGCASDCVMVDGV